MLAVAVAQSSSNDSAVCYGFVDDVLSSHNGASGAESFRWCYVCQVRQVVAPAVRTVGEVCYPYCLIYYMKMSAVGYLEWQWTVVCWIITGQFDSTALRSTKWSWSGGWSAAGERSFSDGQDEERPDTVTYGSSGRPHGECSHLTLPQCSDWWSHHGLNLALSSSSSSSICRLLSACTQSLYCLLLVVLFDIQGAPEKKLSCVVFLSPTANGTQFLKTCQPTSKYLLFFESMSCFLTAFNDKFLTDISMSEKYIN